MTAINPCPRPLPALAAQSWFSLMSGSPSPGELCAALAAAGYDSLAVLDDQNLYGLPAVCAAAAAHGLKALAGARLRRPGGSLYLWVLDRGGYRRLCELLSRLLANPQACALGELLDGGWAGLAVASSDAADLSLATRRGWVDGPWYVALESDAAFRGLALYGREAGLPLLAVVNCRWLGERDLERARLLAAIAGRYSLDGMGATGAAGGATDDTPTVGEAAAPPSSQAYLARQAYLANQASLPSHDHALAIFSAWPEAVQAAIDLAERCPPAASFLSPTPVFPRYNQQSDAATNRQLRSTCLGALAERYPQDRWPAARQRLDRELDIIFRKGFAAYFLLVRDIVALCPRTCGRGSAAASIVAYLLFITHIDPLAHDLFFERFLNEGRVDPPDIDIDFPWDERDAVLRQVFERFAGRVAMVADHCCFSGRSRMREAALAYGKSEAETGRLVAAWSRGDRASLPDYLLGAARLLDGVPRYIGTHPGGVVITPEPIHSYCHTQANPLGWPVLGWEKDGCEQAGLVKIDLLGNRSLAVLRDSLALVNREGHAIGWAGFQPQDDPQARRLIESGRTIGIFYIESPATRQLLQKMRCADFEHLVLCSSIIRPAANKYINEYVARLRGQAWQAISPEVEAVLRDTLGIMVYQEDVARMAIAQAGFSAAEADSLRKILAKKRGADLLSAWRQRFADGCRRQGAGDEVIDSLWEMMQSFAGYSFCKAHSASYALVSYRLAWIKARYPGYFICSVINNGGGFYGTQTYVDEAVRLGYRILQPCVNASQPGYAVCGPASIRMGLGQIQGLSRSCMEALAAERQARGPFRDCPDLLCRLRPGLNDYRGLVRSGALDSLLGSAGHNRPQALWLYHQWRLRRDRGVDGVGADLFGAWQAPACIGDYCQSTKLRDELAYLGLISSTSLPALFRQRASLAAERLGWPEPLRSGQLPGQIGRLVCLLGLRTAGKEVQTVHQQAMSFESFSDEDGVYETVLFPKVYARLLPILEDNSILLVYGRVCIEFEALSVHILGLDGLNRQAAKTRPWERRQSIADSGDSGRREPHTGTTADPVAQAGRA